MQNQSRKNITILIVLLIIAIIAGMAYWIWVKSIALPIEGEMERFEMETVSGEKYDSNINTIKLFSFAGNDCSGRCASMFENLNKVQEKLIEYGSFGKTVELITIAEPQTNKQALEQYIEEYKINQEGWYILNGTEKQVQSVMNQLAFTDDNKSSVYLVDVNHAIRQAYDLSNGGNIEQLIDDITQLIRIHQQYLGEE